MPATLEQQIEWLMQENQTRAQAIHILTEQVERLRQELRQQAQAEPKRGPGRPPKQTPQP